jgi:hypothetical protein
MTTTHPTKPTKFKCTEPGCNEEYNDNAHLGIHKRAAHGILGKSHQAIKKPKRKYSKRSTTLATLPHEEANGQIQRANGQAQTSTRRFHAEAALAVAYGRFQELCKGIAFEYDLPPRSFTARFVELIRAEALR